LLFFFPQYPLTSEKAKHAPMTRNQAQSLQSEPPRYLSHKLLRGRPTRRNLLSVHEHRDLTCFTACNDGWISPIYTLTHIIWLIIAMEGHKINT